MGWIRQWWENMAMVHMAWGCMAWDCMPVGWRRVQVSLAWLNKQQVWGLRQSG